MLLIYQKNQDKYYILHDYNKINWHCLSFNTNAIELLKENKDIINWYYLSLNKELNMKNL